MLQQPLTRQKLLRISLLHRKLRAGESFTTKSFAEEHELKPRSIERDLEFLRNSLGAPVVWDARRRTHRYTEATFELPDALMREGDLLALMVVDKVAEAYRGTPFADRLHATLLKLVDTLPVHVSVSLRDLDKAISVQPQVVPTRTLAAVESLLAARRERHSLRVRYVNQQGDESDRVLDPYNLSLQEGHWCCLAWCHRHQEPRVFRVDRMTALSDTGQTFRVPSGFDPDAYWAQVAAKSFGFLFHDGPTRTVRLRFVSKAARLVQEESWHVSQTSTPGPDGSCLVTFDLADTTSLMPWLLRWGDQVEVLEPPELRAEVREIARRMLATHEG